MMPVEAASLVAGRQAAWALELPLLLLLLLLRPVVGQIEMRGLVHLLLVGMLKVEKH